MCLSWCLLWESLPPPLKGCLFAKKEEGKQPRPHKHTHTHNPKSRRVSPLKITEREWGSEGGDQPPSAVSWLILCECISFQSASLHHSQHAVTHGPCVYPHFLRAHGMMRHHKCILTVNIDLDGKTLKGTNTPWTEEVEDIIQLIPHEHCVYCADLVSKFVTKV